MMDAENVNMYLKYLTDKIENPEKYAAQALEAELSLSNPKTVSVGKNKRELHIVEIDQHLLILFY
tara:strand:- start:120 stop:314 length:195 start_codon:yes stop_codon:yes gene_type:complete